MQNNKRFFLSAAWVLSLHVLTLVFLSLFRLVEYVALGSMVSDTSASVVPAFVRGVWFDNVIACYISVVPLALTLLPATMSLTFRRMRKATVWWYGVLGSVAFMASAANIPYFAYFFKNINSSIFEWFGYAGTTAGMVAGGTFRILPCTSSVRHCTCISWCDCDVGSTAASHNLARRTRAWQPLSAPSTKPHAHNNLG